MPAPKGVQPGGEAAGVAPSLADSFLIHGGSLAAEGPMEMSWPLTEGTVCVRGVQAEGTPACSQPESVIPLQGLCSLWNRTPCSEKALGAGRGSSSQSSGREERAPGVLPPPAPLSEGPPSSVHRALRGLSLFFINFIHFF